MTRGKATGNLSANPVETAPALEFDMLRRTDGVISDSGKAARNLRWRTENQFAIAAYAEEVHKDGLPLAHFRTF